MNCTCGGGGEACYNKVTETHHTIGGNDHETEKIPCPRPRGRDDRSDPHRLRTAGGPLRLVLCGGSSNASHGSEKGLVTESEPLEIKLKEYFGLSETTPSDKAKETLEEVAKKFDAEWLTHGELVNKPAIDAALGSIMKDKLLNQQLCVDVMEWPSSDGTAVTDPGHRMIYVGGYKDRGPDPDTGVPSYDSRLTKYSFLKAQLKSLNINNAELYAGTFQKDGKTYAAMVIIF